MRVVEIVGNRPQFVKAAAVSRSLRGAHEDVLIHTGQHHDANMSEVFFDELAIPRPDHMLGVSGATNTSQTARMLAALEPLLADLQPDVVVVYGDTNTTLAGAIATAQSGIALAHVEAGMRSFDRSMPEELNRVLTDHAADLLLCSTPAAVSNLLREGVSAGVHLVGDVMADIALASMRAARERSRLRETLGLQAGGYLLVTAHRAGNVDTPASLTKLVEVLERLGEPAVFPVHPRTRARLTQFGLAGRAAAIPGLALVDPVGYLDLLALADGARAVVTDSGGLQKEAYLLGTPCVTLREQTEWVETVESGWNVLAGLDSERVLAGLARSPPEEHPALYGDGDAAERIMRTLEEYTC